MVVYSNQGQSDAAKAGTIVIESNRRNAKTGQRTKKVEQVIITNTPTTGAPLLVSNDNYAATNFTDLGYSPVDTVEHPDNPTEYAVSTIDDDFITRAADINPGDDEMTRLNKLSRAGALYVDVDIMKSANDLRNTPKYNVILYKQGDKHLFVLEDDGTIIDGELDERFASFRNRLALKANRLAKPVTDAAHDAIDASKKFANDAIDAAGNALDAAKHWAEDSYDGLKKFFEDAAAKAGEFEWLLYAILIIFGGAVLAVLLGELYVYIAPLLR